MISYTVSHLNDHPVLSLLGVAPITGIHTFKCGSNLSTEKWIDWRSYLLLNQSTLKDSPSDAKKVITHYYQTGWKTEHNCLLRAASDEKLSTGSDQDELITQSEINPNKPALLFIFHGHYARNGGLGVYIKNLSDLLAKDYTIVFLYPWYNELVRVEVDEKWAFVIDSRTNYTSLLNLLDQMKLSGVLVSQCYDFYDGLVMRLLAYLQLPYIVALHDYVYLVKSRPLPEVVVDGGILRKYRTHELLTKAKLVIAPTETVVRKYRETVSSANYVVVPHQVLDFSIKIELSPPSNVTIVTLGSIIDPTKGADLFYRVTIAAPEYKFVVVGEFGKLAPNLRVHGHYTDSNLPSILSKYNSTIFWIPGVCNETYSYTLNWMLRAGRPILAPRLDVYLERCADYSNVYYYDPKSTPQQIKVIIANIIKNYPTSCTKATLVEAINLRHSSIVKETFKMRPNEITALIRARLLPHNNPIKSIFTEIYDKNVWGSPESRSGKGSELRQTRVVSQKLVELSDKYQIKGVLDAPCGDFNWMQHVPLKCSYLGIDVVEPLIKDNISKYGDKFACLDVTKDPLPKMDLILCRDLFIHFSYAAIAAALDNFKKSGAIYLLTTSHPGQPNSDLKMHLRGFRALDLEKAPFNFPKPLEVINENCTESKFYSSKSLMLWRLADLNFKI